MKILGLTKDFFSNPGLDGRIISGNRYKRLAWALRDYDKVSLHIHVKRTKYKLIYIKRKVQGTQMMKRNLRRVRDNLC